MRYTKITEEKLEGVVGGVVNQEGQAESEGELACTPLPRLAPESDFWD